MRVLLLNESGIAEHSNNLTQLINELNASAEFLSRVPVRSLLNLFDSVGKNLLQDERTRVQEGVVFLSNWLRRSNLESLVRLNINGNLEYLDCFVQINSSSFLAAKPRGLVSMWMAGNVATLPVFSFVLALLAKNVCLIKVAYSEPDGLDAILSVFKDSEVDGLTGKAILDCMKVVWFDYRAEDLNLEMSLAADAKVIWGGSEAVRSITSIPKKEHCVEIVFGPKYSLGVIDRKALEQSENIDRVISAFVRDIEFFDQRACSSPQTIFLEKNNRYSLRDVGEMFAERFDKLTPKRNQDAFTTISIMNARAAWALSEDRDAIASKGGADWTVCMDREVALKEAVQSRTLFLTEVDCLQQVIELLSQRVQTIGIVFFEKEDAIRFAESATLAGAVRCVRPGLMNVHESPWDGRLLVNDLVRWVTLKP